MNINIDSAFDNVKTIEELTNKLTRVLQKLQEDLSKQPEFVLITSEEQEIPANTPINSIVFKMDETAVIKTGYYNGDEILLP